MEGGIGLCLEVELGSLGIKGSIEEKLETRKQEGGKGRCDLRHTADVKSRNSGQSVAIMEREGSSDVGLGKRRGINVCGRLLPEP